MFLFINLISAKSTLQFLSLNEEFSSFKFSNNWIIGSWSSFAACCIAMSKGCRFYKDLIPLSLADLSASEADFLSKNVKTIEANPLWYASYFGLLAILKALSLKTLSDSVLS